MALLAIAQEHLPGLKKKTAKEWAGPCPSCGGDDRFLVWVEKDAWHCRGCQKSGDAVAFLREFCGRSCPDAHAELGEPCRSTTCPAAPKCRLRRGDGGTVRQPLRRLVPPAPSAPPAHAPAPASEPAEVWREHAEKLVEHAHGQLLQAPDPLAWLAGRGLPLEAVQRYRLGWLSADLYRSRSGWGLPEVLRDDGKPKKLWLPAGVVLPFFGIDNRPVRVRIRRQHVKPGEGRYYWVPGSGDDVPVLGAGGRARKALVVVESDLDALAVHHAAGDLVGVIPLGSCSTRPKAWAAAELFGAVAVLVALDSDEAGAKATAWWMQHYPRATRWPVPAGKDPGEFAEQGGDLRAWVLAGLPPGLSVCPPAPAAPPAPQEPASEAHPEPNFLRGVSKGGIPYVVAATPDLLKRARELHPEAVPFLQEELRHLKGCSPEEAHAVLLARQAFPEGKIVGRKVLSHA